MPPRQARGQPLHPIYAHSFYVSPAFFRFYLIVQNHGPVPATLTRWQAVIRSDAGQNIGGHGPEDPGLCVFPRRDVVVEALTGEGAEQAQPTVEVEIEVRYRTFYEAQYKTTLSVTGRRHQGRVMYQNAE